MCTCPNMLGRPDSANAGKHLRTYGNHWRTYEPMRSYVTFTRAHTQAHTQTHTGTQISPASRRLGVPGALAWGNHVLDVLNVRVLTQRGHWGPQANKTKHAIHTHPCVYIRNTFAELNDVKLNCVVSITILHRRQMDTRAFRCTVCKCVRTHVLALCKGKGAADLVFELPFHLSGDGSEL